jgi:predicted MFS family arabinose efflux permease
MAVVFLTGMAMFGAIAFVPLYVQSVMGGSATQAGQVLTPLFLGWVLMSVAAARLTVAVGYRPVAIAGSALMTAAFVVLTATAEGPTRTALVASVFVLGCGMGLSMLALLLAVQHGVDRSLLGTVTSLNQFARSVGAAVGVAAMGAILARGLVGVPLVGGVQALASTTVQLDAAVRIQFARALARVFAAGGVISAASLAASFALPRVDFARGAAARPHSLASEMSDVGPGSNTAA